MRQGRKKRNKASSRFLLRASGAYPCWGALAHSVGHAPWSVRTCQLSLVERCSWGRWSVMHSLASPARESRQAQMQELAAGRSGWHAQEWWG